MENLTERGSPMDKREEYLTTTPWEQFKKRIPWLLLLMVSTTFTGMIITAFQDALAARVALTAFIPMLMGTGGNSGSQTSATVIRGLSLGEVTVCHLSRVLWQELRTAILCGGVLSVACFLKIWLVDGLLLGNDQITPGINGVVCLALFVTVVAAKLIGAILPVMAKRLRMDPAVMASPLITTLVDTLSLLVYFLLARFFLKI